MKPSPSTRLSNRPRSASFSVVRQGEKSCCRPCRSDRARHGPKKYPNLSFAVTSIKLAQYRDSFAGEFLTVIGDVEIVKEKLRP